jgi:hypothetical protein
MEIAIGRYLTGTEIVHHKDENKSNNVLDNLELLPNRAAHIAIHNRINDGPLNKARLSEQQVREALQGRSTAEAAALLGIHHQTLRNRYGDGHLREEQHLLGSEVAEGREAARIST